MKLKLIVLGAALFFGGMCWAGLTFLLIRLGLTPAQAIAVVTIAACLAVLACFRIVDRAETEDGADGR